MIQCETCGFTGTTKDFDQHQCIKHDSNGGSNWAKVRNWFKKKPKKPSMMEQMYADNKFARELASKSLGVPQYPFVLTEQQRKFLESVPKSLMNIPQTQAMNNVIERGKYSDIEQDILKIIRERYILYRNQRATTV